MHHHPGRKIPENFIFDLHQLSKVDGDLQINFFEIFYSARAAQHLFSASIKKLFYAFG